MKKLGLISLLAFILFFQVANAQYCQTIVSVSVSPSSIYQGDCITISGTVSSTRTCRPDPPVYLYLDGNYMATVNTDSQNRFSYTYFTSFLSPGTHVIKAVSRIDCCAEGYGTTSFYVNPRCEAKYLDIWQCSGNWRQRQYQNSDCSLVWQNYEYCPNGCSAGQCIQCTPKYLNEYRCSGNWKQQLYQFSDCRTEWKNVEYCAYGCSAGLCVSAPCRISATLTTPSDVYFGNTISTTINFFNSGPGGYVEYTAYVCRADGSNCQTMNCNGYNGYDPNVFIPGHSSRSFTCSLTANELSLHKIKLVYSDCERDDPVIYSGVFEVKPYPSCTPGYLNSFQCFGNWKQQLYQFSDCRTEWKNIVYCEYGCSAGQCLEAAKKGEPKIFVEPEYFVKKCEKNKLVFELENVGEARDDFSISFSGSAAKWVRSISSVSLEPGEKRRITAYVSVPCGAEGEYDLEILVTDGTKDSAGTVLVIEEKFAFPTGWFILPGCALKILVYAFLILVIILIIILLILLIRKILRRSRRKEQPESFSEFSEFRQNRKRPESFLERECHHR